jgi:hypothetical protein
LRYLLKARAFLKETTFPVLELQKAAFLKGAYLPVFEQTGEDRGETGYNVSGEMKPNIREIRVWASM